MFMGCKLIFVFAIILVLAARTKALPPGNVEVIRGTVRVLQDTVQKLSNLLIARTNNEIINIGENCKAGLKSGAVKNNQMTASSFYAGRNDMHQPFKARLDSRGLRDSWAASARKIGQWIQVDMQVLTLVTGVITQGRQDCCAQWVTGFKIAYGNSATSLQYIKDQQGKDIIFKGNRDKTSHVLNKFPHPVLARYFRLVVQTWHQHISLRMEYTTC